MGSKKNMLIGAGVGYVGAVISSWFLPELASLVIPAAGAMVGGLIPSRSRTRNSIDATPSSQQLPSGGYNGGEPIQGGPNQGHSYSPHLFNPQQGAPIQQQPEPPRAAPVVEEKPKPVVSAEFAPVIEYLEVLEDMIISEGQKNTLDSEIVDKSLSLFARVQRVIPLLDQLGDGNINHTIRRLVLKDLNGFINPFLRLSGEAKSKNRRTLLNGLKDVDTKISDIASTIEHKDLLELQTKAELIHQRYRGSDL
ncbi:hypothetical protein [Paenibacillus harenae]|uniref:Uncharacterized protein n=1 Tax=Paenibacillus harenae TaxID=306543 RepID=A0ABT9U2W8_PAEHA|nr:hypothetical protein [Paenibacillus harenae]MDQ0113411.1 hypothetical protein [Paenibacillus harenae]